MNLTAKEIEKKWDDEEFKKWDVNPMYFISNYGRVYSLYTNQFLKKHLGPKGYHLLVLKRSDSEGAKLHKCHRVVAKLFIGPPTEKRYDINHIDADKLNNHPSNLEWVTHQENMAHAKKLGIFKRTTTRGENCGPFKLTKEEVVQIRNLYKETKNPYSTIAKEYSISEHTVRRIIRNMNWKHVGGPIHKEIKSHGEGHHKTKLTKEDVIEIIRLKRTKNLTHKELAKMFGVHPSNIGFIVRRESWKSITEDEIVEAIH